ncbi:TIGR03943 family putative permease subunit [Streptomyces sp. ME19-01-6]|uniref:TIGR03943 family putative permease subunit n=1 Tax=Streptomyces sp. ME19-01-6 TaxID=3028686 RepID=UPI0029B3B285|nr:TIGR03943 family protein [Streptomyces sp. ME19-01-6]MDX3233080.1 TIGR03943 family protein [Streptomyces sp. ME19-01-6]
MNRKAQAVVLFLVGVAMLRAGFTDLYLRYVKAGLRPLLLASGGVLIVTAVATVRYELRRPSAPRDHEPECASHDGGGGHAHREPRVSWLLVLPLFALILVAPPALGSYSAMHTGTALQRPWGFPDLPAKDPLPLSVADYAGRAVYDHGHSLRHRRIKITGFVAFDRDGAPHLVRMALNCCAADAQPVKIGLTGRIPPVVQPDTWLEVTGTYTGKQTEDPLGGGTIPFIDVSRARPVATPRDPYDESWNG